MKFLSAKELKITELQREALIKALVYLEDGCLRHIEMGTLVVYTDESRLTKQQALNKPLHFNMLHWRDEIIDYDTEHSCGTVCCIGGTAELLTPRVRLTNTKSKGLQELFFPSIHGWDQIKPSHAVKALKNYLTTGNPNWQKVMK